MATPLTTDIGEEYLLTVSQGGDTIKFLLYDESTDTITETDDLAAITTEPDNTNSYARQSSLVSTAQLTGSGGSDFGYSNDSQISFDTSTNTETGIDAIGYIANFTSQVAGDASATDHLIAVDALSTSYDLNNQSSIDFNAGGIEHVITGSP